MELSEKDLLSVLDPKVIISWCDLVKDFYSLNHYEKICVSNIRYWALALIRFQKGDDK